MAADIPAVELAKDAPVRVFDPRVMVRVYDNTTNRKLDRPVPETWLDGRFPQLSQTPSTLKGGN